MPGCADMCDYNMYHLITIIIIYVHVLHFLWISEIIPALSQDTRIVHADRVLNKYSDI